MTDFPLLKTGAIAQYPSQKTCLYSTRIMRFVDGSEQRYREYSGPLRQWTIQLDLLDESELNQIEAFFAGHRRAENFYFTFRDPWDGVEYPNCGIEDGELALKYIRQGRGEAIVRVKQYRG